MAADIMTPPSIADVGGCAGKVWLEIQRFPGNVGVSGKSDRIAVGAAYLAGLAVGYWPDQETVKQNGAIDRTFEPELSKEERDEKMNGWHKAVRYAEGWAK